MSRYGGYVTLPGFTEHTARLHRNLLVSAYFFIALRLGNIPFGNNLFGLDLSQVDSWRINTVLIIPIIYLFFVYIFNVINEVNTVQYYKLKSFNDYLDHGHEKVSSFFLKAHELDPNTINPIPTINNINQSIDDINTLIKEYEKERRGYFMVLKGRLIFDVFTAFTTFALAIIIYIKDFFNLC